MRLCRVSFGLPPVALLACAAGPADGFVSGVGPGDTGAASSTSGAASSTPGEASSTSTGSSTTGEASSTTGEASSTTTVYDLGAAGDLGPLQPPGCKDKIDFLFMMQRYYQSTETQEKLIAAFPDFIATIEDRFAGFDVQIMVVDSDWNWGLSACEPNGCFETGNNGCEVENYYIPDYPCGVYAEITKDKCNVTLGAGVTFNAGVGAANVPCQIDDARRYITQEQSDLAGTFACMAKVGQAASQRVGSTIVQAVSPEMNQPGGCNAGFVRDDALLMVTLIVTSGDEVSEGSPVDWANAVFKAKNGNKDSVIMLGIGGWIDPPEKTGKLGEFVRLFPYSRYGHITDPDYGPHFAAAVDLVDEACRVFTPG